MIGVVFAEEKDAAMFYKKVTSRKPDKGMQVLMLLPWETSIYIHVFSRKDFAGTTKGQERWKDRQINDLRTSSWFIQTRCTCWV